MSGQSWCCVTCSSARAVKSCRGRQRSLDVGVSLSLDRPRRFKPLQLPAASDNQQQGGGGEGEIGNDGRKGDVTALLLVDEVEEEVQ